MICNVAGEQGRVWIPKYFKGSFYEGEDWTDLALASYLGLKLVVRDILVEEKTDINARGGPNGTALHIASAEGHKEIVQMLLDKGADINAQDESYRTALYIALEEGYKEIVQMLLDKGADINTQGGFYGTALRIASLNGHKEIVQMLLSIGTQEIFASARLA